MTIRLRVERRKTLRAVGLMSGTSADGIDAAVVDAAPRGARVLAFHTFSYAPQVRRRIFRLFDPATSDVDEVCRMNFLLGGLFAEAALGIIRRARVPLKSVDLIASHGQTIRHLPGGARDGRRSNGSTLQIGEPSVIAERTGILTVADFRPRDMAAGGQGAPLVPYADFLLFAHSTRSRAVQNIGGIANVTWLPAGRRAEQVIAFDTGPGNMMMDRAAQLLTGGRKAFDAGGRIALRGRVNEALLAELMRHPFLRRRPPKTTGREEFGAAMTDAVYRRATGAGASGADVMATLAAFTAETIAQAYARYLPARPDEVILCGGGARNPALVGMIRERLRPAKILIMDELGINADAKEAVSFALLGCATVRGQSNNVPAATGARRAVVLGKIIPGG